MLNIASILNFIHSALQSGSDRFTVQGDEVVVDNETGVELHMFDTCFEVKHGDTTVARSDDFTNDEQSRVMSIKHLITTEDVRKYKEDNYEHLIRERRKTLSDLYESPTPLNVGVTPEQDTTEYAG